MRDGKAGRRLPRQDGDGVFQLRALHVGVDQLRLGLAPLSKLARNRSERVFKAYLLKESLERLWQYRYRGAMLNYLNKWIDQLKWQRLVPFEKLAAMLLKHLDGIANYCETKVRFGVVEAVNGNIRMLINRGRGYKNLRYLLLKAKRMAVMNLEFIALHRMKEVA